MKTPKHKFLGYFQTTGGPVCICNLSKLHTWSGAETEESDYWKMIAKIDSMKLWDIYQNEYLIFNTDTGNFSIFTTTNSVIIVESIYTESNYAINWEGIEFDSINSSLLNVNLSGMIAIFDSALKIAYNLVPIPNTYQILETGFFNVALLKGYMPYIEEVEFKSSTVHYIGIRLY